MNARTGDGGGNGGGGPSVPPYPPKHEHRDSPHTRRGTAIFRTLVPLEDLHRWWLFHRGPVCFFSFFSSSFLVSSFIFFFVFLQWDSNTLDSFLRSVPIEETPVILDNRSRKCLLFEGGNGATLTGSECDSVALSCHDVTRTGAFGADLVNRIRDRSVTIDSFESMPIEVIPIILIIIRARVLG